MRPAAQIHQFPLSKKEKGDGRFGERIAQCRLWAGYSKLEVVELCGNKFTVRSLYGWESGKNIPPRGPAVRALGELYRKPPGWFYVGDKGKPPS